MPLRDLIVTLLVCLVWAGNSVVSKLVVSNLGAPPIFYCLVRFALVSVVSLPWLLPAPKPLWRAVVVGLLMGAGTFALVFMGLKTTTPSSMAVVSQLGAPMATVLSVAVLGERIHWRRGLGIVLTFGGVLLVMWDPHGLSLTTGTLLIAGSAFTGALGAVMMKQMEGVSPLKFQAWVAFSSVWLLAALTLLLERNQGAMLRAPAVWPFLAAVLFSGLVVSVVAHTAYYWLIGRHEVNLLQPLTLMTPLATIVLGVIVTHDRFDAREAVGSAIALIGVLIIALRPNRSDPDLLLRESAP